MPIRQTNAKTEEMLSRTIHYDDAREWLQACYVHDCKFPLIQQNNTYARIVGYECLNCNKILGIGIVGIKQTQKKLPVGGKELLMTQVGRNKLAEDINERIAHGCIFIKEEYNV